MNGSIGALPPGILISWYGDDFTGSSAVMEVLTFGGLPAVLFVGLPSPERIAQYPGYRGVGIAGIARAKSPQWMETSLPSVFATLESIRAPVAHYKVCSTLDSAPHIGSIGKAIDLGAPILGGVWHPFLVAAPAIRRYQVFGNLFAGVGESIYRLDRHPTMSRHPVTPMEEADVRLHVGKQTSERFGLVDVNAIRLGHAETVLAAEWARGAKIVAFDAIDENDLAEAGRLIWENRGARLFAIGSQGIEYALMAHWRRNGLVASPEQSPAVRPVDQLVAVSGSCAPQTAQQIAIAIEAGFVPVLIEAAKAVDPDAWRLEIERATNQTLAALSSGQSPIAFTALGPDDPRVGDFRAAISQIGGSSSVVNERIGSGLGGLLNGVFRTTRLRRGVIVGGDTSGIGAAALGAHALTALASTGPGAALFRAHCDDPTLDGLEIALKGGQMGTPDYFLQIRGGNSPGAAISLSPLGGKIA
jgi:3-oxoisoapionate kinase